ncbi:MAG: SGNH/GDSL hydrolase family protein [Acidimicrobiales bacterium]
MTSRITSAVVAGLSLLLAATTSSTLVVAATAAPAAAASGEEAIEIRAAGPLGAISVLGDSVLVGAAIEPSLPTNLAALGWGPIRFRAGLGYTAGNFQPSGSKFSVVNWINWWRAEGWDAPNVAVNLGNNDVGFCKADIACNAGTIRYVLDAIGPGHTVWWSRITRLYTLQAEADAYNAALDLVAAERGNLRIWDWPAAQAANAIPLSWDAIHVRDATGYRLRSVLMAADITSQLASATRTGTDAPLPAASGAATEYQPLAPTRVLDTRDQPNGRLAAGGQVTIDLSSRVPAGTTAVAVNLTSVDPSTAGFLTGHPCSPVPPTVSSANFAAHTDRGALAVLPLDASQHLCVLTSSAADLVVDLQGAFVADGSRLATVAPQRLADTRDSGRVSPLRLDVPLGSTADATGVVLNLTATGATRRGFVTAYPCGGAVPTVSNVNFGVGETVAGAAFVPLGDGGDVCVFSNVQADVDLVVDLTGVFSPTGPLAFTPATPTRTYDTRDGTGGWTPVQGAGQTTDVRVAPATAVAVTGTLTMVTPATAGFLTAFGCGAPPSTSNVNAPKGGVLANSITTGLAADGRLCVRSSSTSHVVFDTTGWWAP